ncbi:MAG: 3-deoxy-D-manno-octulosonic acid transferase [Verrucomicrobiales bacterium]|nr:3-deoxy-D-manno-octulosonic acid transferase [Verrucomicrobiales bacterium]
MRACYNILFAILLVLSAPYYLLKMMRRGGWRSGLGERFGRFSSRIKVGLTNRQVLWLHAASVGEVNLALPLLQALERRVPNLKLVCSTYTSTGREELHRRLPGHIEKIYWPLDLRRWVSRALKVIRPKVVVLVESEIWPNFLWSLRARRTPVVLVNARLSERSYRAYRRFGFLFRPLLETFAGVGAQTETDAARWVELGCRPETVQVLGSLKFEGARLEERCALDVAAILRQLGVPADAPVLLGGSTHAGEEAVLAEVFQRLRSRFPDLFLVLVPRHFERGREVGRELEQRGIPFIYRREITAAKRWADRSLQALVVNTTGELRSFYEEATVIFVGKSLTARGGQNPIEPGALGKAMVFGPNMQNFEAIAAAFVREEGAVQVQDAAGLERVVGELLADGARRSVLGAHALRVVKSSIGAIERSVDMIVRQLPPEETYVAPGA